MIAAVAERPFGFPVPAVLVLLWSLAPVPAVAQGTVVRDTIRSEALATNRTGDAAAREVLVYLPQEYAAGKDSFPVLYLLHGVTSVPGEWLDGSYQGFDLTATMDSLVTTGAPPYIVVMPDVNNGIGGSFYANSASLGRWEDFVAVEVVQFVDSRYRTLRARDSRGLAGHSMGGFGALYLGARHPGTFGHVYAMSPCCLGFTGELSPDSAVWTEITEVRDLAAASSAARRVRMMAAAFTGAHPDTALRRVPFRVVSGASFEDPVALAAWRSHLPLERFEADSAAYRSMLSLTLDYGTADAIPSVGAGTQALSKRLTAVQIPHRMMPYEGGHIDRLRERFTRHLLPYFARVLRHGSTGR